MPPPFVRRFSRSPCCRRRPDAPAAFPQPAAGKRDSAEPHRSLPGAVPLRETPAPGLPFAVITFLRAVFWGGPAVRAAETEITPEGKGWALQTIAVVFFFPTARVKPAGEGLWPEAGAERALRGRPLPWGSFPPWLGASCAPHTPRMPLTPHACPPRCPAYPTRAHLASLRAPRVDTLGAALHMLAPQPHVCGGSTRSSSLRCWGRNSLAVVVSEGLRALSLGYGYREGGTELQHLTEV